MVNALSVTPQMAGVRVFLANLIRELAVQVEEPARIQILCTEENLQALPLPAGVQTLSVGERRGSRVRRVISEIFLTRRWIGDASRTVLLSPSAAASAFVRAPQIVVIQSSLMLPSVRAQLSSVEIPGSIVTRLGHSFLLHWSLRKARAVIAVSNFVAREIVASFPFAEPKLAVVYEGVDRRVFSGPSVAAVGADSPYLLLVGTLYRYKNVDRAIEALAHLRGAADVPPDLRLKVVGKDPDGRQRARLLAVASDVGVGSSIDLVGPVDQRTVRSLYWGAAALVFPSRIESFGLPVLEAMSAGTPVVCSNRGALPEVAGEAAEVVDCDHDAQELAQAVRRVMT
ncbi:MAG: glycosyltransferase family 1 protein, partial [Acidobacteriota bacterium]